LRIHSGSKRTNDRKLAGSGRAIVIGKKTDGSDMDAEGIELPSGAVLLYPYVQPRTPKGVIIEGHHLQQPVLYPHFSKGSSF
jgi:hypothetical protein